MNRIFTILMQSFKSILFTISTFLSSLRNFSFVLLPKNFVVLPFTFTCNTFRVVFHIWSPLQFSSITQPCPTLCNPMDCSTPGFLVPHQLPEAVQTHVNQVGDAIQSPYPLSSPSPPAFNLSEHQGLFKLIFFFFFLHQVTKVLEFQLQHQSFQWILRTDFL